MWADMIDVIIRIYEEKEAMFIFARYEKGKTCSMN